MRVRECTCASLCGSVGELILAKSTCSSRLCRRWHSDVFAMYSTSLLSRSDAFADVLLRSTATRRRVRSSLSFGFAFLSCSTILRTLFHSAPHLDRVPRHLPLTPRPVLCKSNYHARAFLSTLKPRDRLNKHRSSLKSPRPSFVALPSPMLCPSLLELMAAPETPTNSSTTAKTVTRLLRCDLRSRAAECCLDGQSTGRAIVKMHAIGTTL